MDLLIIIYVAFITIISGIYFILIFYNYFSKISIYIIIAISYLIGLASHSLIMLICGLINISFWYSYVFIFANLLILLLYKNKFLKLLKNTTFHTTSIISNKNIINNNYITYILIILTLILYLYQFTSITMNGSIYWDAWANWSMKGKIMHVMDAINTDDKYLSKYNYLEKGQSDYPFMIPIEQTWIYHHLGYINEELMKYIFFFILTCFIIITFDFFYSRYGINPALFVLIFLLSIENFSYYLKVGYMDPIVMIYSAISVLFFIKYIESFDINNLYISTIFASISPWIKNDGLFPILSLSILIILSYIIFKKISIKELVILLFINFSIQIFWKIIVKIYGLQSWINLDIMNTNISTYPIFIQYIFNTSLIVINNFSWIFFSIMFLISLFYIQKEKKYLIVFYTIIYGLLIFILFVLITKDLEILKFYQATNIDRIWMQAQISAFIIAFYLFFDLISDDKKIFTWATK